MRYLQELKNKFAREEIYPIEYYWMNNKYREELNLVDKAIGYIKRNKKLYKKLVVCLALFSFTTITGFAEGGGIDNAGLKFLNLARKIAYWVLLIKASSDVIKKALAGDLQSITSTIVKYVIAYGSLYLLPWAFHQAEGLF